MEEKRGVAGRSVIRDCPKDDDDKQDVYVIAKWVSSTELPDSLSYSAMVTPNLISFRLGKLKQEGVVGCILWRWQETKDSIADDTPRRNLRLPPNPS